MKYYYDLHIHSCLSPCGDGDMTPNNIVNMAKLKELDIIAVTDHNSAGNLDAFFACAAESGICAVAGMEVESAEEIHLLTLFPTPESCHDMELLIASAMPAIKNKEAIFGEQLLCDRNDQVIGKVENLLVTATTLTLEQITAAAEGLGGVCIPAHIDRDSYSILSTFGVMPEFPEFPTVEVSPKGAAQGFGLDSLWLHQYRVITSSDAHYLWDIAERERYLELETLSPQAVIDCIKKGIEPDKFIV